MLLLMIKEIILINFQGKGFAGVHMKGGRPVGDLRGKSVGSADSECYCPKDVCMWEPRAVGALRTRYSNGRSRLACVRNPTVCQR